MSDHISDPRQMVPVTLVKHEVRQLYSRHRDHTLMYPEPQIFTWIKAPGLPWILAGFAAAEQQAPA